MSSAPKRVLVVGAGISGLSLAHFLRVGAPRAKQHLEITVVDKAPEAGGWIKTDRGEDFLFEKGPRSLLPALYPLRIAEQLGLSEEVVTPSEASKKRYVLIDGKLETPPERPSLGQFLFKKLGRKLWYPMLQELRRPKFKDNDMSVHDFILRRTNRYVAEVLGSAFIYGVYGGDSRSLSMRSAFPRLWYIHKKFGSIIRGLSFHAPQNADQEEKAVRVGAIVRLSEEQQVHLSDWLEGMMKQPMYSFKNGMQTLPDALYKDLSDDGSVTFRLGSEVSALTHKTSGAASGGGASASTSESSDGTKSVPNNIEVVIDGKPESYDHVFTTLSAVDTARILESSSSAAVKNGAEDEATVQSELAKKFGSIPHSSVITVNVGYSKPVLKNPGFGVLIPRTEEPMVLGITFDSSTFPQHNYNDEQTRLTVMLGGSDPRHSDIFKMSEAELEAHVKKEVKRILNIDEECDYIKVNYNTNCIPQYPVGHYKTVAEVRELAAKLPNVSLSGTGLGGVSVNDCIDRSQKAAGRYLISLDTTLEEAEDEATSHNTGMEM